MANEMKDKVKKKYYRRVLEKSVGNKIKYWQCFQNISREEAFFVAKSWGDADYELLTMHNGLQPKSNVERLYPLRSEGGRGLIGVQDTAETVILALRDYARNSKDRLLHAQKNTIKNYQMSTKREKIIKGKHSGHKNNYIGNSSGKQRVKQMRIGKDG